MVENVGALRLGLVCPRGVVGSPDPGRSPGREQTRLLALPLWVMPARVHPCPRQLCPVSSPSRLVVCTPALFVLSCLPAFSQRDTLGSSQPRRPWKRLPFSTSEQHPVVRMERHFVHPSVHGPGDTWVVPAFGHRDRRRCAKICSRPCAHRRSVRAMGRFRVYCFEGPATCLPQQLPRFPFPPATPESRSRSASRPARTPSVPGLAIPAGTEETPVVVVSCVLSVAKDVEHLSVCSSPTILIYLFIYSDVYIFKWKTSTSV